MGLTKNYFDRHLRLPVYGGGADIKTDAWLKRGATPATDQGALIKASGASAQADMIGWLRELHDYSVDGDTLANGTNFVPREVELNRNIKIKRVEYSQGSSDIITCTQAVNSTTMTVGSLENNIDAGGIYVVSGTGAGQTNFIVASDSGFCTLKAAFGTDLDTTSKFIKILPRFHKLVALDSDGVKLTSQAAAGAVDCLVIDTWIQYGGDIVPFDPTKHAALTGLNSTYGTKFFADVHVRETVFNID